MQPRVSIRCKNFSIHLLSGQFLDGNCATECDGCGQYLWVCPVGEAMGPDGNPKKLEPMYQRLSEANKHFVHVYSWFSTTQLL